MGIKAVIFDLDGTIVQNSYDWSTIRKELGTEDTSLLGYLNSLKEPDRTRKWEILERHEFEQTAGSLLRQGVNELLAFLKAEGVKSALVTNNSRANTDYLIAKFRLSFDLVLTREAGLWKPSGVPFRKVMQAFDVSAEDCCVVGDTRFDILAAMDAGITSIFLLSADPEAFAADPVEVFDSVESLQDRLADLI